ncbi:helix-turn-helix domain-containing protein [Hymenobacter sp. HSC-4F20]|uniref:helix-turn-helix domain-containing protein n=1 Tax=Hymenobacter sp. HSC-4F20 TaxID=2864135 RepID=UPI001C7348C9|nr:helix-turn-helix domain-containing protein [Hymenobacter sp. HSC-4F20]MBX0291938.1 helix-turn-helix domain-containing protein [Hymenobacter sp. HSC-4F20]
MKLEIIINMKNRNNGQSSSAVAPSLLPTVFSSPVITMEHAAFLHLCQQIAELHKLIADQKKANQPERFYEVVEVAKLLKYSSKTVREWINSGKLPAYNTSSGTGVRNSIRVTESDLRLFMMGNRL